MEDNRQQIVERLKKANNVLVTVRNSPSIDQLTSCIGLSLALIKRCLAVIYRLLLSSCNLKTL
jgi:nanoRNase/pAp phosphatase (c-di-AMP/oligoRNAs hydrolase)